MSVERDAGRPVPPTLRIVRVSSIFVADEQTATDLAGDDRVKRRGGMTTARLDQCYGLQWVGFDWTANGRRGLRYGTD